MKNFQRNDRLFSLCGLCTMRLGGHCPGCGGEGGRSRAIARCSLDHGGPEYCWQCGEFPCARYRESGCCDSFITYQNRLADMEKMCSAGPAAYQAEQREKCEILWVLLENHNDGRRKTLFALAVNLLEPGELREILETLAEEAAGWPLQERTARGAALCREAAARRGINLRLRRKSEKSRK